MVVFSPIRSAKPKRDAQLCLSGRIKVGVVFAGSPVIGFGPAKTNCLPIASNQEEFGGLLGLLYQDVHSYRKPRLIVRLRLIFQSSWK